jgi:hypothetical protein
MSTLHMLTTVDNPFSPVTQYDEWERWDEEARYFTPALLARIAVTSDELSETDQDLALEEAIDVIVNEIQPGFYIKVSQETDS